MVDELPSRAVYQFLKEFTDHDSFVEFARQFLLASREINDIEQDYSSWSSKERRYQMIARWKFLKGRAATMDKLRQLKREYIAETGGSVEDPLEVGNDGPNERLQPEVAVQANREAERQPARLQVSNPRLANPVPEAQQPEPLGHRYPQSLSCNHDNQRMPASDNRQDDGQRPRERIFVSDPAEQLQRLRL